jgi:hypothetical protein
MFANAHIGAGAMVNIDFLMRHGWSRRATVEIGTKWIS